MALELRQRPPLAREQAIGLPRHGEMHGHEADFGLVHGFNLAAERAGDDLMTQAHADDRELGIVGRADER